ncbi:hypothetical protein ACG2F4_18010 [Halalkalibaculum sp. DA3122]|uniref:hypothetical protein n=1 Tax=Halalkalibaculum sp. DA384 TaxID=3373606 RepID=UPI0037541C1C
MDQVLPIGKYRLCWLLIDEKPGKMIKLCYNGRNLYRREEILLIIYLKIPGKTNHDSQQINFGNLIYKNLRNPNESYV